MEYREYRIRPHNAEEERRLLEWAHQSHINVEVVRAEEPSQLSRYSVAPQPVMSRQEAEEVIKNFVGSITPEEGKRRLALLKQMREEEWD